jgi:hypothetical protein
MGQSTDDTPSEHRPAEPSENPPSGMSGYTHELLMELTTDEVIEWCADISVKRERLRAVGQEFGSWMLSNALSVGDRELGRRGYSWQAIHDAIDERTFRFHHSCHKRVVHW